jgi:RNA polymerase sigma-70 factor, ECF subfamily
MRKRHRRDPADTGSCRTSSRRARPRLSPDLGEKERSYVFAVAMKYMKDEEAADDVAQDALLLAHRHRASFRGDSRFSTWLYRIAATTALMHLRKRRRTAREVPVSARDEEAVAFDDRTADAVGSDPETQLGNSEAVDLVRNYLGELGDKYEQIFWMRYLEGYTESEIASQLDLTLATVKTRAHRARVSVRDRLIGDLAA